MSLFVEKTSQRRHLISQRPDKTSKIKKQNMGGICTAKKKKEKEVNRVHEANLLDEYFIQTDMWVSSAQVVFCTKSSG